MTRVFVSHSGIDAKVASATSRWLANAGHEVFLAQDLRNGIEVGEQWEPRIYDRLRWAEAVICLVTPAYLESIWCAAEIAIARTRGIRLIPVGLESGLVHPLLSSVQQLDGSSSAAGLRERLLEVLQLVEAAGGSGWTSDRSPFPGLRPFTTDWYPVFFGRGVEVAALTELLRSPAERSEGSILMVVGPSGCGKSSLVQAGLVPLITVDPEWLVLPAIQPGPDPLTALVREIAGSARHLGLTWGMSEVRTRVRQHGLNDLIDDLLLAAPGPRRKRMLLVVDQFEELLVQTPPSECAQFAALLRSAMRGPLQVVGTLRPEYYDQLLLSEELAGLHIRTFDVRPLSQEAMRLVIQEPARLAGLEIDDELVARMVADTGGGEALPLLSYTLARLAEGVERGGQLSIARYESQGGVQGTLTHQADAAMKDAMANTRCSSEMVIRSLLRLVTVDENGQPTRWRLSRRQLPQDVALILDPFISRRLLLTDHTVVGEAVADATVQVAHEAFLSAWPPLATAIDENAAALRARRAVERAAVEWVADGRPAGRLWERGQLAAALADTGVTLTSSKKSSEAVSTADMATDERAPRWALKRRILASERVHLSAGALEFLYSSVRRDRFRRRRISLVLSILLVLAVAAAAVAFGQLRVAEERLRLAASRQLQAEAVLDPEPQIALRLKEAALSISPSAETRSELINAVATTRYLARLSGDADVKSVAFAPDGSTVATAGADGRVILWGVLGPSVGVKLGQTPADSSSPAVGVAFAPVGRLLAVAAGHGVTLWDVHDPAQPARVGIELETDSDVGSLAFAPDGRTLAVGAGNISLWNVSNPEQPDSIEEPLNGHDNTITSMAFSPDGLKMASASFDHAILWDTSDPSHPRQLGRPFAGASLEATRFNPVTAVAFSVDGTTLATGQLFESVVLWDISKPESPRAIGQPLATNGSVYSVAFSSGGVLAAAGRDNKVTLWDVTDRVLPRRLKDDWANHSEAVATVAFSPDGRTLVSGSWDNSAILWDLAASYQPTIINGQLETENGVVNSAVFSPDGRVLATTKDRSAVLWDVLDPVHPTRLSTLTGHTFEVQSLSFSPDGRMLLTAASDNTVGIWDVADLSNPRRLGTLDGHTKPVLSATFSPDGTGVATASADGTIGLWDLSRPAHPESVATLSNGPLANALWDARVPANQLIAFSPDGHLLAIAHGRTSVYLWNINDLAHPRHIGELGPHSEPVVAVAFTADGRTVATGSIDNRVVLWDVTDPTTVNRVGAPLSGHTNTMTTLVFASDGRTLISGSKDGSVVLWDLTDSKHPRQLGDPFIPKRGYPIHAVALSPDGNTLATAQFITATLWDLSGANRLRLDPLARACSLSQGGLDRQEWQRYLSNLTYRDVCAS